MYDEQSGNNVPQPDRIVTVLEVSPFEADHNALRRIFSHSNWKLLITRSCAEATAFLKTKLIPVVLCERELPDGTWKDILERTLGPPIRRPLLLVRGWPTTGCGPRCSTWEATMCCPSRSGKQKCSAM